MKQRGRAPATALELPSPEMLDRVDRLRPPHQLTDEQTEIWFAVVNSEAADWFSPSTAPLLAQYCRHVVQSNLVAGWIEQAAADKDLDIRHYDKLLSMQERETDAISKLASKMRISQQATINQRGNKKPNIVIQRPWKIR